MADTAKIKKWKSKSREYAERAEAAAKRAEQAAARIDAVMALPAQDHDEDARPAVYTSPRGIGDTPAAAGG